MKDSDIGMKLRFYIMSLWLLFVLIFFLTVDVLDCFENDGQFVGLYSMLKKNWLAIVSLFFAILGVFFAIATEWKWTGVSNPPYKIEKIRNENYEYLTFLTTYIIPLICFDLEKIRYIIVLIVVLVLIGYIFIKMDLYYGNPTLALMGYRLYRVELKNLEETEEIILISKDRLSKTSSIRWIPIDKNVWIAKEAKNDN